MRNQDTVPYHVHLTHSKNQEKSEMYLNIQSVPHSKFTLQIWYEKQLGNAVYEKVATFFSEL